MTRKIFTSIPRRFIKLRRIPLRLITCGLILFFTGLLQTTSAQSTEELLDSAILYERLKVVHVKLKTAYDIQGKETQYLRDALQMQQLREKLQREEFERIRDADRSRRRKAIWRSIGGGIVAGIFIGILTLN